MQCVTPMIRKYTTDGKKQQIVPRQEVYKELERYKNSIKFKLNVMNKELSRKGSLWRYQTIPCGHCYACQLNYSAEWATRLTLEAKKYEYKYFITLTYDDYSLTIPKIKTDGTKFYRDDGTWNGTLVKEDMDRLIHTIRQYYKRQKIEDKGGRIKYFYCGEYGGSDKKDGSGTLRPHYHMILFGAPLDVSKFYDFHVDKRFKLHWKSKELDEWWGKGIIDIAEVEWSDCAYVARYCMKKLEREGINYAELGKDKEFIHMSDGIGMDYYEKNKKEIYHTDSIVMKTVKGNTGAFKPPKAFDRKFKEEFPDEYEKLKVTRQLAAERARKAKEALTDYTDFENLNMKAEKVYTKAKQLPRDL